MTVKTSAEMQIEQIAKGRLEAGESATIEKARAEAWTTNPDLYESHKAEVRSPAYLAKVDKQNSARIAKGADRIHLPGRNAEIQLDAMAKRYSQETGTPYAKAYTAVLDTPDGRRLYAEHKAAKVA